MSIENERRRSERRRKRYAEDPGYRKKQIDRSRAYRAAHRAEINARCRRKWAEHPEIKRANELKHRYGISLEQYELILASQNGVCAICRKKPKGLLCVDHCHTTGMVRGLLCTKCNTALGFYDDDPDRTQAATDYLRAAYARLRRWRGFEATGNVMIPIDEQAETGKDGRLMRRAILLELRCQPGKADSGAADKLRLIARRLVDKAAEGDIQAIKEVLDRIDGKTVPGPGDAEQAPQQVSIRWRNPAPSPTTSPGGN